MAHPQIAAFARLADGGAIANRKIEGQKTMLGRTMHGIFYDEIHDEITVPQPFSQSVMTFRGGANGEEAPIRVIQGLRTQLRNPDKVTVDPVHNEIFVPEVSVESRVLVFAREANGNVAPIRILEGPGTPWGPSEVAVDPVHNLLVVSASWQEGGDSRRGLMIFNRTDEGNVKPRAIISGPKTGLQRTSRINVYPPRGLVFVSVPGPGTGPGERIASDASFVGVWNILQDQGDVPPRWKIGGPKGLLRQPRGVTYDAKNKTVIVSDKYLNAVMTYYFPEIF
ncbi:MAG: hypothetical protein IH846_17505 [Acidobacteria bacterium]|nr:hypothetical protein [Acidobacteriota bacterium]